MLLGKIMERIKANKEKTAIITDDKPFTYEDLLSCYEDYADILLSVYNISNVNTVGFRGSTVNFTDVFYQTTQNASGPNATTGTAGTNAVQIGLGSNVAAISVDLSGTGATQRTDRGMDLMINGDAFLIVRSNGNTYFTKSGALDIDANGTLYCTTNGASVLGS